MRNRHSAELYTLYAGWAFRFKTLPDGRRQMARLRRMGMFTQANGSLTLTNPRVLESAAQYFDCKLTRRPPN